LAKVRKRILFSKSWIC